MEPELTGYYKQESMSGWLGTGDPFYGIISAPKR